MKKTLTRLLAIVLAICMTMSYIVPASYAASETNVVYDFVQLPYAGGIYTGLGSSESPANQFARALQGGDWLTNLACKLSIPERYALTAGEQYALNWTYEAASAGMRRTATEEAHLPNSNARFIKTSGLRCVITQDEWIAFRIKSPGAGTYAIDLTYYGYTGSGTVAFYILEAEGAASVEQADVLARAENIHAAMDPDNRVGMVDLYNGTANASNSAFIGNWTFEENKEYIVVAECYEEAPIPVNRYVYMTNLTMTAGGKTAEDEAAKERVRAQTVKENVITVADAGTMAAVWEMDGQDYYFLPIEGGQLLVFNLDTWELVKKVNSGIDYPTSVAVMEKEDGTVDIYITGNNKLMFRYNPYTGESFTTSQYNNFAGLADNYAVRGLDTHNGKVYLGLSYGGNLAEYDPEKNTYRNLGDMIATEFTEDEDGGDGNGGISAIACYGDYLYMNAGSPSGDKIIKYDLVNERKVTEVDITSQMETASGSIGLNVLGNGDYLIAGGIGFNGLVLIDLATMKQVSYAQALALGLDDTAWTKGMNQMATEVIETSDSSGNKLYKQYFVAGGLLYAYNTQTKLFEKIGGGFNGFNVVGKQSVTLSVNGGAEQLYLFAYAAGGQVRLCSPTVGEKISLNGLMKAEYGTGGADMRINTVGEDDDANTLYMGASNTAGCSAYDSETGIFTAYQTMGQTDSQVWYQGKLYAGNYSQCVVYQIDMADADNNTAVISNMAGYEQKRIHTLTAGDGYVFAGTIPTTYIHGGGIGMYNTVTGEERFLRFVKTPANGEAVVPAEFCELWNQSVIGLSYQNGLLYGCTSRAGGTGSSYAADTSARIFVYDYENNAILATLDLRDHIAALPDANNDGTTDPIDYIGSITADPVVEGRFWGVVSDVLFTFTFDRTTKQWEVQVVHDQKHTEYNASGNRGSFMIPVVFDPANRNVYVAFASAGIYCITLKTWDTAVEEASQQLTGVAPIFYAMGAEDMLYYASGADLKVLPVNVTAEDWAISQAWDAQIKALGDITLDSASAIQEAWTAYENLPLRDKCLVQNMAMLEEAEAQLLELLITAEADSLSSDSVEVLEGYLAQYEAMTARQQRYVKNYTVLSESYEEAVEIRENEAVVAAQVQAQIDALNVTSVDDAAAVTAAREAYEALNDRQKELVDITALTAAETRLATLVSAAEVQAQINALPDSATLEDEATVAAVRAVYDTLSDEVKAEVVITKLETAEAQIADWKAAQAAQEIINALPEEVTLEDRAAITTAREAYDALSNVVKASVNTAKLFSAESQLAKLIAVAAELQVYDFKLYNNASYMDYVKEKIIAKGAPEDVVLADHNLYKYTYTSAISYTSPYTWFGANYSDTINWAPEGSCGAATDPGKDYNVLVATQSGMRLNFEKPASATKKDYTAFRIQVLSAGTYHIDLSLFEGGNSSMLATGDVLDFYIFPAYEDYALNNQNYIQIKPYLVDDYYAGSLTYTTQANAGDRSTYTISQAYTFPTAGDYIIVVQENAIDTCNYLHLDSLTLRENVTEADAVAEVDGKYFRNVKNALNYQVENGASAAVLKADAETGVVSLPENAVLDLNGKTLTADAFDAVAPGAQIIDSTSGNGILVVEKGDDLFNVTNAQLPVYDETEGGYRFFEVEVKAVTVTGKTDPKYWFKIDIDNFGVLYNLIKAGSELNIAAKLTCDDIKAEAVADADFLQKWAEKYNTTNGDFYITVSAVNAEGLESFSLIPCITANGVDICGDEM